MNTQPRTTSLRVAVQAANNSTGWVGEVPGNNEHLVKGQTFLANEDGDLRSIKVFSNVVARDSNVMMTLHSYDPNNQSWGKVLGSASMEFELQPNKVVVLSIVYNFL